MLELHFLKSKWRDARDHFIEPVVFDVVGDLAGLPVHNEDGVELAHPLRLFGVDGRILGICRVKCDVVSNLAFLYILLIVIFFEAHDLAGVLAQVFVGIETICIHVIFVCTVSKGLCTVMDLIISQAHWRLGSEHVNYEIIIIPG